MTGILPIKKYGTHSALNMFRKFSMLDAGQIADYYGDVLLIGVNYDKKTKKHQCKIEKYTK